MAKVKLSDSQRHHLREIANGPHTEDGWYARAWTIRTPTLDAIERAGLIETRQTPGSAARFTYWPQARLTDAGKQHMKDNPHG